MAALALPIPGTKYGPCLPSCTHVDCLQTRKDADEPCTLCGKPIGYDERCYSQDDNGKNWRHMICAVQEARGEPIGRRLPHKQLLNANFYPIAKDKNLATLDRFFFGK